MDVIAEWWRLPREATEQLVALRRLLERTGRLHEPEYSEPNVYRVDGGVLELVYEGGAVSYAYDGASGTVLETRHGTTTWWTAKGRGQQEP
jgi:hypothetical protein